MPALRAKLGPAAAPPARAAIVLTAVLTLLALGGPEVLAYDAGYHFDLTREALVREEFASEAITVTQLGNYNNDGFESAKAVMADETVRALYLDDDWGDLYGPAAMRDASDVYFHFDALSNYAEVEAAWDRLVRNTYAAARQAEASGDADGLLTLLGMSLHQLQDFYAHSNWADLDFGGDATWFDITPAERRRADIYTTGRISHDLLQKDTAGQPSFETSYRQAFYASWQWSRLVQTWVSPSFWDAARATTSPASRVEAHFVRYLAWYTGHWKGSSSESRDDNAALGLVYMIMAHRDYLDHWRTYCPILTQEPDRTTTVPMALARVPSQTWLALRTDRARQTDNDLVWDIDPGGQADFYAKITVNGLTYIEAMHEDSDDIRPTNWLTLVPLGSATSVRVVYELWDEDVAAGGLVASFRGDDDYCDIARDLGRRYWFIDGAVSALRGTFTYQTDGFRYGAGAFDPDGDGDEAAVDLTMTILDPPYTPVTIGRAITPMSVPPPPPIVTDEGAWTSLPSRLSATWTVSRGAGLGGPVEEYRYRVLRSTGLSAPLPVTSPITSFTSAALATSADIPLALENGQTYFIEVQARNTTGWSSSGLSDGITADLLRPTVSVGALEQTTAWPLGSWPSGPPVVYPNSLRVELDVADADSGPARYTLRLCHETRLDGGPNLPQGTVIRTVVAHAGLDVADATDDTTFIFRDLPLTGAEEYILEAVAFDRAGNESLKTEARVIVNFVDTTPPPAPRLYVSMSGGLRVQWDPVFDSESGIREYLVAVGSRLAGPTAPDIVSWTSIGRATTYANTGLSGIGRLWVKVVNGVGLETVVTYDEPLPGTTPPPPPSVIKVSIWGRDLAMDVPPQMVGGRVLVPMRALFESLGATVNWDPALRKVTGKREGRTIILTAGSNRASVRGNAMTLDVPATVIGGRVFVPLRFISEVLGAAVNWDAGARTVRITMKD
jgi:hypothetical protein